MPDVIYNFTLTAGMFSKVRNRMEGAQIRIDPNFNLASFIETNTAFINGDDPIHFLKFIKTFENSVKNSQGLGLSEGENLGEAVRDALYK